MFKVTKKIIAAAVGAGTVTTFGLGLGLGLQEQYKSTESVTQYKIHSVSLNQGTDKLSPMTYNVEDQSWSKIYDTEKSKNEFLAQFKEFIKKTKYGDKNSIKVQTSWKSYEKTFEQKQNWSFKGLSGTTTLQDGHFIQIQAYYSVV